MQGISAVDVLNTLARIEPARRHRDIAFTDGLELDVYTPRFGGSGDAPVVVFCYGGGWDSGNRQMYPFVGRALASHGIVAVIADYRVFPEVRFPDFLRDAAQAVRWTKRNIASFGGDPRRLVLLGQSAGAHIAAMLAFDRQWLGQVGLDADRDLSGLVGLAGPYDFLPLHSRHLETIFGPEELLPQTQPINFVDRPVIPTLLAVGSADTVVDPANSTRLAARIDAQGSEVELISYPRIGHEMTIGGFAWPLRPTVPVMRDTLRFVRRVTARPRVAADEPEPALCAC